MCDDSSLQNEVTRGSEAQKAWQQICIAVNDENLKLIASQETSELKQGAKAIANGAAGFQLVAMDSRSLKKGQTIATRASVAINQLLSALERLERENSDLKVANLQLKTENDLAAAAATAARGVEQTIRSRAPPVQKPPKVARTNSTAVSWEYVQNLESDKVCEFVTCAEKPTVKALDPRGNNFLINGFDFQDEFLGFGKLQAFDVIPYLHNKLLPTTSGDFGLQLAQSNANQGITLTYNRLPVLRLPSLVESAMLGGGPLSAYAFLGTKDFGSADLQWPVPYDAYLQINSTVKRKASTASGSGIKSMTVYDYPVDVVFGMPTDGMFTVDHVILQFAFKDQNANLKFTPVNSVARFSEEVQNSDFQAPSATVDDPPKFVVKHKLSFITTVANETVSALMTRLQAQQVSADEASNYGFDADALGDGRLLMRIRVGHFQIQSAKSASAGGANVRLSRGTKPDSMSGSCTLGYRVLGPTNSLAVDVLATHTTSSAFGFMTKPGNLNFANNAGPNIFKSFEEARDGYEKLDKSERHVYEPFAKTDPRRTAVMRIAHAAARKISQMFAHLYMSTPCNVSREVKILQSAPTAGYMAIYKNLTQASEKDLIKQTKDLVASHYHLDVPPKMSRSSRQASTSDPDLAGAHQLMGLRPNPTFLPAAFPMPQLTGLDPAEQQLAKQQLAEQQLAEQKLAEKQLAEQQLAEQQLAKQQLAEQQLAEKQSAAEQSLLSWGSPAPLDDPLPRHEMDFDEFGPVFGLSRGVSEQDPMQVGSKALPPRRP
jgi:hypothetical protein